MAIKLPSVSESIDVPLRVDDALAMTDEQYDKYLETLDNNLLQFQDGQIPTFFKLRKVLPLRLAEVVENKKVSIDKSGEVKANMAYVLEEVRVALVGIENPPGLPEDQKIEFKRDGDGGASTELVAQLNALGVVMDLWKARQTLSGAKKQDIDKKK